MLGRDNQWEGELDRDQLHEALLHPIAFGEEMERRTAL